MTSLNGNELVELGNSVEQPPKGSTVKIKRRLPVLSNATNPVRQATKKVCEFYHITKKNFKKRSNVDKRELYRQYLESFEPLKKEYVK